MVSLGRTTPPTGGESNASPPSRHRLAATIAAVAAIVLGGTALAAPKNGDELLKDEVHRLAQAKKSFSGGNKGGSALNIDVVGHEVLGGRGFNGDVWSHEASPLATGASPIGRPATLGSARALRTTVAVVDASDAADPVMVARLQNPEGTSAEDVVVYTAETGPPRRAGHRRNLRIQVCGGSRSDMSFRAGCSCGTSPIRPTRPSRVLGLGVLHARRPRVRSGTSRRSRSNLCPPHGPDEPLSGRYNPVGLPRRRW